mgnify:CR=1 FL=1
MKPWTKKRHAEWDQGIDKVRPLTGAHEALIDCMAELEVVQGKLERAAKACYRMNHWFGKYPEFVPDFGVYGVNVRESQAAISAVIAENMELLQ